MSNFNYFSKNGKVLPTSEAKVSLFNIEYSYGYGVYETLKIRNNILYFADLHLDRLEKSANTINIPLPYPKDEIKKYLHQFIEKLATNSCNIKIVVIGGNKPNLYIFATNPYYPDRKLYRKGAKLISYKYERLFPQAKTLNMLNSYIAYTRARNRGCYDALLIGDGNEILEGTRTNFFLIQDQVIYHTPKDRILEGVTFLTLTTVLEEHGFSIKEKIVRLEEIGQFEGAFITSTSTKVMPVSEIDDRRLQIPENMHKIMKLYQHFLEEGKGVFHKP